MGWRLGAGVVGSVCIHGLLVFVLLVFNAPSAVGRPKDRVVEFEVIEVKPQPPPPPEPTPEPELPPKPEPPKPRPKPPPPKVMPKAPEPPPSNDAPPPEPPKKPVPLLTGISMASVVSSGQGSGFRVVVGNTLYGRPDRTVKTDPKEVQPYEGAETFVPMHEVTRLPEVRREVKAVYPDEARQAGIEGAVKLRLEINAQGKVVSVKVLKGRGYGLDEAAMRAMRKTLFKPATVDGQAVSTLLHYTYTFLLD